MGFDTIEINLVVVVKGLTEFLLYSFEEVERLQKRMYAQFLKKIRIIFENLSL